MAQLIPVFLALVAGAVAGFAWRERKRQRESFLVLTNGKTVRVMRCEVGRGMFKVANDEIYPDAGAMVTYHGRDTYYLLAVEPVALATHQALEALRPGIVAGSLFKPGGAFIELARTAAMVISLAVALMVWSGMGTIQGQIAVQTANVAELRRILDKPLVALPTGPTSTVAPTPTP